MIEKAMMLKVNKKKLVAIVSPPYEISGNKADHLLFNQNYNSRKCGMGRWHQVDKDYGNNPQNIGNIKDNSITEEDFDITRFHQFGELCWKGCYDSFRDWRKFVTDESFAHPAKCSPKLADKIFRHLKKYNLINEGDTVIDFMSGIGTTNIMASIHGFNSVAIELEQHFIDMVLGYDCDGKEKHIEEDKTQYGKCKANKPHEPHHVLGNKEKCEKKFQKKLNWKIIQGDSRRLGKLLEDRGFVGITLPVYCNMKIVNRKAVRESGDRFKVIGCSVKEGYSSDPNNIGNLKDKQIVGITSPPYQDICLGMKDKTVKDLMQKGISEKEAKHLLSHTMKEKTYNKENPNNIGNLKDKQMVGLVSPPFLEVQQQNRQGGIQKHSKDCECNYCKKNEGNLGESQGYQEQNISKNNIGNLKDKQMFAIVSPPYEDIIIGRGIHPHMQGLISKLSGIPVKDFANNPELHKKAVKIAQDKLMKDYSSDPNNIGNLPDKQMVGLVSPPYINAGVKADENPENYIRREEERYQLMLKKGIKRPKIVPGRYSGNRENIGNLPDNQMFAIVSPPYADVDRRDRSKEAHWNEEKMKKMAGGSVKIAKGYQANKNNIGILSDKQLVGVCSPPFSDMNHPKGMSEEYQKKFLEKHSKKWGKNRARPFVNIDFEYSNNKENIGNQKSQSYLEAMLQVYSEAYKSGISPLILITKNPTRGGKIRRLDLDSVRLLQMVGYEIIDYHRATLFEEHEQQTLEGDSFKKIRGRISFFKLLSYNKGNVVASFEDIIIAIIPKYEMEQ